MKGDEFQNAIDEGVIKPLATRKDITDYKKSLKAPKNNNNLVEMFKVYGDIKSFAHDELEELETLIQKIVDKYKDAKVKSTTSVLNCLSNTKDDENSRFKKVSYVRLLTH